MPPSRSSLLCLLLTAGAAHAAGGASAEDDLQRALEANHPAPARVRVELVGIGNGDYAVLAASFTLDGKPLPAPDPKSLTGAGGHLVFQGELAPGNHQLECRLEIADTRSQVFAAEGGTRWKPASVVRFHAGEGLEVQLRVSPAVDKSADVKNRIKVGIPVGYAMLAAVDDGKDAEAAAAKAAADTKRQRADAENEDTLRAVADAEDRAQRTRADAGNRLAVAAAAVKPRAAKAARPTPKAPDAQPAPALARILAVHGAVTLERAGKTQPAAPGPLFCGDRLATGEASSALLRTADGHRLRLGAHSRFVVGQRQTAVTLALDEGTIEILALEADAGTPPGALALLTRFGESSIEPETQGRISVGMGGLSVDVEAGDIVVTTPDGGTRTAAVGKGLRLAMGGIEVEEQAVPDAGAAAAASPVPASPAPRGCGCTAVGEPPGDLFFAVLALAAWCRRRSRRI